MIQHLVLLKFKPEVTPDQIDQIFTHLAELKNLIPGIIGFNGGPYSSPEGLNQGYTHGFIMTFETADHRDAYLPHPEHEKVKVMVLNYLDDLIAFDFDVAP
ncbi:Dabb family protein [Planktothrix pseudagardhii]|uniref:Stress-response A/B barrel domain-containing protein HS1 n=1 Tax=Planktothrix pseudagardhii TaxID=132604 RepID=A0A9W4G312_9CYAN|nr:Dabb family protein [Planktothrix pseudagardhii]CAD5929955.1 Stress-response A/B barrel domain-containing protein HS1 [Planktothrix pseudagardhii]